GVARDYPVLDRRDVLVFGNPRRLLGGVRLYAFFVDRRQLQLNWHTNFDGVTGVLEVDVQLGRCGSDRSRVPRIDAAWDGGRVVVDLDAVVDRRPRTTSRK